MAVRWKKLALRGVAISAGVLAGFALLALFAIATPPGHWMIAWLVEPLTGGDVVVSDLSGGLPDHLHAGSVELRDAKGAWLRIENVQLDWHALSLLSNHIDIEHADAQRIVMLRRQEPSKETSSDLRIDIADLHVGRIDIAKAAFGRKAVLAASGSIHYSSLSDVTANITARRLDGDGLYRIDASIHDKIVKGSAIIAESGDGFAGSAIGFVNLGPVSLDARATLAGNANSIAFDLRAGALKASGRGTIDLAARAGDIAFSASAPAMRPRPDLGWSAFAAHGTMQGSFDRSQIEAALTIDNLTVAGFSASHVSAALHGQQGIAQFDGDLEHLTIPGKEPDLFAASPVHLSARADLEAPLRPVTFTLDHPLLQAKGQADTRADMNANATLTIPSLAPFAALAGADLSGRGMFSVKIMKGASARAVALSGSIAAQGGTMIARLLGNHATVDISGSLQGSQIAGAEGSLIGSAIRAGFSGTTKAGALAYRWNLSIGDMSRIAPTILGTLDLGGELRGRPENLRLAAAGGGMLGTKSFAREKIALTFNAGGLPKLQHGDFLVTGRFDAAPVIIRGQIARDAALTATLDSATWKSVAATGTITVAPGDPHGTVNLRVANLSDLGALLGMKLEGALDAGAEIRTQDGHASAILHGHAQKLAFGTEEADRLDIAGNIADPFAKPVLSLTAAATGLRAQGFSGTANIRIDGPPQTPTIALSADMMRGGEQVSLLANALLNTKGETIVLRQLRGVRGARTLNLTAPATIGFADGIDIDRLQANAGGARLELAGRISPKLALTISVDRVTPDMLGPPVAAGTLDGSLRASATLAGTPQSPEGSFELQGSNLRVRGTAQSAFPAATLDAHGSVRNSVVTLDAVLAGGNSIALAAQGDVPLDGRHAMVLHAKGSADLGILSTFLAATGQSLSGKVTLDGQLGGTLPQPLVTGNIKLTDGEFRDYARGLRLREIDAVAQAQGSTIRIVSMTARAGQGTVSGSGTVDLAAPGIGVDIVFTAKGARPIVSDSVTATLDAGLHLKGRMQGHVTLSGDIRIDQGEIRIPDKFPPSVAVLDVRRRGEQPAAPAAPNGIIAFDVNVAAPARVFVRGRGLDAELAGQLRIAGTTQAPQIIGALDMRRGTLSIAGQTLDFRSGKVSFDGSGLGNRLDPTLDFEAQTNSGGVTATLTISGYASAPQIQLSSSPALPQDEILARLLFQQSVKQLSPLQLTEIAQALASLSGIGSGFDPVGMLRRSLGLDRLAVGGGSETSATIEAGKYVTHNIYVGAKQDLSGGTRAAAEVDLTKHLKATASVSTAAPASATTTGASAEDRGDTVGLSYQLEY